MYTGIIRTAITNDLPLELNYREPSNVKADVNSEEYFEQISTLIASDFRRLLQQI
jgi:hypothetical protein